MVSVADSSVSTDVPSESDVELDELIFSVVCTFYEGLCPGCEDEFDEHLPSCKISVEQVGTPLAMPLCRRPRD